MFLVTSERRWGQHPRHCLSQVKFIEARDDYKSHDAPNQHCPMCLLSKGNTHLHITSIRDNLSQPLMESTWFGTSRCSIHWHLALRPLHQLPGKKLYRSDCSTPDLTLWRASSKGHHYRNSSYLVKLFNDRDYGDDSETIYLRNITVTRQPSFLLFLSASWSWA